MEACNIWKAWGRRGCVAIQESERKLWGRIIESN